MFKRYNHFKMLLLSDSYLQGDPRLKVNVPNERAYTGSYLWITVTILLPITLYLHCFMLWWYCDFEGKGRDLNCNCKRKFLSEHIMGWVCSLQGLFCNKTQGSNARQ